MTKPALIFLIALFSFTQSKFTEEEPVQFVYGKEKYLFPSTVKEAVKKHHLNYKPPGYYYKVNKQEMEVLLGYHFEPGDFYNEYQPKKTLYPRKLHSYIFRFNEREGLFDSLKYEVEKAYKQKFVLTRGIKDSKYAMEKNFEYDFLKVNEHLTIGIAASPERNKKDRKVVVRFMYNLPLGKMGIQMGNYL